MHLTNVFVASSLATVAAAAHSNLDWYAPRVTHKQVCGHPGDSRPQNCDDFYNDVKNEMHTKVMDTCKKTSCSGSFEHYHYNVQVEAIFPPGAKGEFDEQMRNIIDRMLTHENQEAITDFPIETKFSIPHKMILNRFGDGNEKGHMELTVTKNDEDGLCEIFKKLGTAGSVIPKVGPFFGLINLADC